MPPKGAPNVLLIMTDDQGYGVSGTFGGVIPTPNMDRIAKSGLRYTQFHSTALCSPTRAALITGRNHHSVGFGVIGELSTGYPGYNSVIGPESATIGTILRDNGYATSWFGKNHNTPTYLYSAAGPFDQWPVGMGFQYFYGFMGGETDQWTPYLFKNTTQIFPWIGKTNYNLTTDMADEAINYMNSLNAAAPDKPFFVYYVPGGTHSPHQPKKEWIDKFKGKFDMGWEKLREQIFANQKRLGVIPANTQLTPWPAVGHSGRVAVNFGTRRISESRSNSPNMQDAPISRKAYELNHPSLPNKHTPDQGRLLFALGFLPPTRYDITLSMSGNRFSSLAVFSIECTSRLFQPYFSKNWGPSSGANRNRAFARLIASPIF